MSHTRLIVLFCFNLICSASALAQNLPDLGSPGLVSYDRATEIKLGQAFSRTLHTQYDLVEDPQVLSYIRRIGHHLASHTQDPRPFRFYIINDPAINAFAGPDGIIGIHTGLILSAQTEDELASVIAHEIAHVTQQHLSRRFEQQDSLNITSFASLLAAILIGSQNPSAGMATLMGTTGLNLQQQLKFSRIHEHEADHLGIQLLHNAGYDPHAMAHFFDKLSKQYQLYEFRPPEILMTHPVTESRLAQAVARARMLDTKESQYDPLNLALIQQRIQYINQNQPIGATSHNNVVNCYARLSFNQYNLEQQCLTEALKQHPNNRLLKTLQLTLKLNHDPKRAIKELEALNAIYPQDEAILGILANAYHQQGMFEKAQQTLIKKTPEMLYQYALYQQLSNLYAQQNKLAEAYYYEALANLSIGQHERSRHFLKQSQQANHPSEQPQLNKLIEGLAKELNSSINSKH